MTVPTRTKRLSADGSESPDFGWVSARWFGCSLMRMGVFGLVTCISIAGCFDDFESSDVSRAVFKCADDNDCGSNQTCANNVCVTAPEPSGLSCETIEVSTCEEETLLADLCANVNSTRRSLDEADADHLSRLCDIFQGCPPPARCGQDFSAPELFVCALNSASSLCDAYADCWESEEEECGFVDCIEENYSQGAADLLHRLTCNSEAVQCASDYDCETDSLCVDRECQPVLAILGVSDECVTYMLYQYEDHADYCEFLSSCASDDGVFPCEEFYESCADYQDQDELRRYYCGG